jgi:hypothetical protein
LRQKFYTGVPHAATDITDLTAASDIATNLQRPRCTRARRIEQQLYDRERQLPG